MSVVDRIVEHFDRLNGGRGGLTAFSKAMDHKYPSTVQGWKERGTVPQKEIPSVIAVCAKHGLELDYSDFFDSTSDRSTEDEAQAEVA